MTERACNHDLTCLECQKKYKGFHASGKFCSSACRWRWREKQPGRLEQKKINHALWRDANKEWRREYMLKRSFGISQNKYEELLEEQGGGCAICGKTEEEEGRALAVDHDHGTGEIFGILCMICNRILVGKVREPAAFRRAALYLEKGTGLFVPKKIRRRTKVRAPRKERKPRGNKT